MKAVLDPCCGSCAMWFDKADPRAVFKALPMSAELYAERSKAHREKLRELRTSMRPKAEGGMSLLFAAIVDAVKCGGGDELAALRRLEGMVRP